LRWLNAYLRSLKEAGMAWISMGLQSGSDHVCREIYKRTSVKKDFLRAAEMVKGFGLAALYDVILDNPLERDQDRLETVKALIETPKPFVVQFFSLTLYHGTELYERANKECPEMMQDAREKDCLQYERTPLNALTRLAAFLPENVMRKILKLYRREPGSMWFKAVFTVAKMLNSSFLEPLACFMVLKRSERGSYRGAFGKIHVYLKELWSRYCKQFRRARSRAPEDRPAT